MKQESDTLTQDTEVESPAEAEAVREVDATEEVPRIVVRDVDFCYGAAKALEDVSLDIPDRRVTAFIGPSGCGKSTLLRCFNRMNDMIAGARVTRGTIHIGGEEIHDPAVDPVELRRKIGMVFQKSNPFAKTIFENVAYGLKLNGKPGQAELAEGVESALRAAALWDEVKDRLNESANGLSGGQQQRLCIARAIAVQPEILLMDEPCSALDPIAAAKVEDLILQLKEEFTIVVVTHNMQQATRISDVTAFFYLGKLIESGATTKLFSNPSRTETEDYISGRFG